MTGLFVALLAAIFQSGSDPAGGWTWSLYDDDPVVLANEIPDTARLRYTLECDPGSSVARLSLYQSGPATGFARVSAGATSAMTQVETSRAGGTRMVLRTDHPVFAAFMVDGRLIVTIGDTRQTLEVQRLHLNKLRRFADLCSR